MKKIPLSDISSKAEERRGRRLFFEAFEILLFGMVWGFVLVWLPFFQQHSPGTGEFDLLWEGAKAYGVTICGLSLVLLLPGFSGLRWQIWGPLTLLIFSSGVLLYFGRFAAQEAVINILAIVQLMLTVFLFWMRRRVPVPQS